jgi:hypothetical protein
LSTAWTFRNEYVTGAKTPGPAHAPVLLVDKLAPEAKLIFVGACSLKPLLAQPGEAPVFLQMWDIHDSRFDHAETRQRAIVLPIGNDVQLGQAAGVWRTILFEMTVHNKTIREAVVTANQQNPSLQVDVYGNDTVHF